MSTDRRLHIETPLSLSATLSTRLGCSVALKLDAMQPTGSFKLRGVGYACTEYAKQGAKRFIASSGGNAGIAVAYAGCQLGVPVAVYVPESTSTHAREQIVQWGAELHVVGHDWAAAHGAAQKDMRTDDVFIHPFDDPLLWQGHSSLVDELEAASVQPSHIIVAVGGGGLLCGVAEGLARHNWETEIIAVETHGADSYSQARSSNTHIKLPQISSIASSLGATQVARQAFELHQSQTIQPVVVSDTQAVAACAKFLNDHRILVEPACGAALAAAYEQCVNFAADAQVVIVVCGGSTARYEDLIRYPGWPETAAPSPSDRY